MVELSQSLALIAASLNEDARAAVLGLLTGELKDQVEDLVRRVDPEDETLEAYQLQLLTGFAPPRQEQDPVSADAEDAADLTEVVGIDIDPDDSDRGAQGLVAMLAMLCATGPQDIAADLLVHLPLHLQGQVIPKLLKTSPLSATSGLLPLHRDLVEALRAAVPKREAWGVDPVCQILRSLDSTRQLRRLLTTADAVDHESVIILQNHLFNFADLLRLSGRDQQALLMQVDNQTLGQALQMTDENVHKGLLANVSVRRRSLIAEEEQRWSESTVQEIEVAQHGMLAMARHLYEQGKITTYFGSVSRTGLIEDDDEVEEQEESAEAEESAEGEETVDGEEEKNTRGLLVAGLVMVFASVVVWGGVSLFTLDEQKKPISTKKSTSEKSFSKGIIATERSDLGSDVGRPSVQAPSQEAIGHSLPMAAEMEVPGKARIEALQQSEIEASEENEAALMVRVGKIRTRVLDEDFELRTPVVKIMGVLRGAVFDTKVVLDASTIVEVGLGMVEVHSLLREGQHWRVGQGMRGRFDTAGNGRIEKIKTDGS